MKSNWVSLCGLLAAVCAVQATHTFYCKYLTRTHTHRRFRIPLKSTRSLRLISLQSKTPESYFSLVSAETAKPSLNTGWSRRMFCSGSVDTVDHLILIERHKLWTGSPHICQTEPFCLQLTVMPHQRDLFLWCSSRFWPGPNTIFCILASSRAKGIFYCRYADDIHLYISFTPWYV